MGFGDQLGSAFEHSFPLPKPANPDPGAARKGKAAKPGRKGSGSQPTKTP